MAKCRVYLFTYKRNQLLKRAVNSLLAQTFTDWVCEVHNDLPGDTFPEEYITSLNDKRFTIVNHPVNYGTTKSFNFAFKGCAELYASMLEDDNWWEPGFLDEMVHLMDNNPTLDVAWSNMFVWKELPGDEWVNTGKTLWPTDADKSFSWPQCIQALGSLHSTGAMIYKGSKAINYTIPDITLSNSVELVRERCFEHPIYLKTKPLANFSFTIVSSQSNDTIKWTGTQTMMLASYIINAQNKRTEFIKLLNYNRPTSPSTVPLFSLAVAFYLKEWALLYNLKLSDWMITIRWWIVNLFKIPGLKSYLRSQQQTWTFLKSKTPNILQ